MFVDDDGDAGGLFRVSVRAHTARLLGATTPWTLLAWRGGVSNYRRHQTVRRRPAPPLPSSHTTYTPSLSSLPTFNTVRPHLSVARRITLHHHQQQQPARRHAVNDQRSTVTVLYI